MTGWGIAAGITTTLVAVVTARWRKAKRQADADLEEQITRLRYYVRQHPELLEHGNG